jgi:multisubunit Na+/H+ antiporter MnhB subunit
MKELMEVSITFWVVLIIMSVLCMEMESSFIKAAIVVLIGLIMAIAVVYLNNDGDND